MATCVVHLENFHGQYYPGNTITGKVVCSFTKPMNIRGVRVKLQGKEHTEWQEEETTFEKGSEPNYRTVRYTGNNNVLDAVNTLTGEGKYSPGRYEYSFSFHLPRNLPGSFNGTKGSIKYTVKGVIVIPFGIDYVDTKEVRVIAPISFNETPGVNMDPVTYSAEKDVKWLFTSLGMITVRMYLEKAAFVQGEAVKVRLELTNLSTANTTKVEAKMMKVIEYDVLHPAKRTKCESEVLAVFSDTGVGANGERVYAFHLVVPSSVVVPNFNLSRLFRLSAKIDVTVSVSGFHTNLDLTAPIYLGHVPLSGNMGHPAHFSTNVHQTHSYPSAPGVSYPGPPHYPPYSNPFAPAPSAPPRELPLPYTEFPQGTSSAGTLYPTLSPSGTNTVRNAPTPEEDLNPPKSKDVVDDDFVLL